LQSVSSNLIGYLLCEIGNMYNFEGLWGMHLLGYNPGSNLKGKGSTYG
jgi:hypothetical protein